MATKVTQITNIAKVFDKINGPRVCMSKGLTFGAEVWTRIKFGLTEDDGKELGVSLFF